MRPRTAGGNTGCAGLAIGTGWSSNSKMRSDDDMADCMTAYLVEKSRIGTKKRCMYSMKDTNVPKARAPAMISPPPYQMMTPSVIELTASTIENKVASKMLAV